MIVYLVTNLVNGKQYVGETVRTLVQRWYQHTLVKSGKRTVLRSAISKYGVENFKVETLGTYLSKKEMDDAERFYIKNLNTMVPNGYNRTEGGDGCSGLNISKETREKMSKAKKGKRLSPATEFRKGEHFHAATEIKLGEHLSEITEFKPGMATWNKGISMYNGKENHFYGKKHTLEAKDKMRAAKKNKPWSEARRAAYEVRKGGPNGKRK